MNANNLMTTLGEVITDWAPIAQKPAALFGGRSSPQELLRCGQLRPDSAVDMCIYLSDQLRASRPAYQRHQSLPGRCINSLAGCDNADQVSLGRNELAGILQLVDGSADAIRSQSAHCSLPYAKVETLLARLNDLMSVKRERNPVRRPRVAATDTSRSPRLSVQTSMG